MTHTIMRPMATLTVVALAMLGVAACGLSGTGGNDAGAPPNTTATYDSTPTSVSAPTATPVATHGASVPGQVTVTLDKAVYAPTDIIAVSVNNGLPVAIYIADHQTDCTIVTLQQSLGDTWRPVGACRVMTPTGLVRIAAHSTALVWLGGRPGQLANPSWPAGTYRVQVAFSGSPIPNRSAPISSATFQVV